MKGMQQIKRGRGFRGLFTYVFANPKSRFLCASDCVISDTGDDLASEFGAAHVLNPKIKKPVWHNSLRLPPGEQIDDIRLESIARDYMGRMGFTPEYQWAAVVHDDDDGLHIHIAASRVSLERKTYLGKNENLISTRHISELEIVHGLQVTKGLQYKDDRIDRDYKKADIKLATKAEIARHNEKTKHLALSDMLPRHYMQDVLESAIKYRDVKKFVEHLQSAGISVSANVASSKANGFSLEYAGEKYKAGDLGAAYRWAALSKSLSYEQSRDIEYLRSLGPRFIPNGMNGEPTSDLGAKDIGGRPTHYKAVVGKRAGVEMIYIHSTLNTIALVERSNKIEVRLTDNETVRAGMSLAAAKWNKFEITGSPAFKASAILECVALGVEKQITNPDLQEAIKDEVAKRDAAKNPPLPVAAPRKIMELSDVLMPGQSIFRRQPAGPAPASPVIDDYAERLSRIRAASQLMPYQKSGDNIYLAAAAEFEKQQIAAGEIPTAAAWRAWDREIGAALLWSQYAPSDLRAAQALTRLSPAALRSIEAVKAAIEAGKPEPDVVISAYGRDEIARLRKSLDAQTDIDVAPRRPRI